MNSNIAEVQAVFSELPGHSLLLLPDPPKYTIVAATKGFEEITGRTQESLSNQGFFELFRNNPVDGQKDTEASLRMSLEYVIERRSEHSLGLQQYDVNNHDSFDQHHWSVINKPVMDADGNLKFIIHTASNVSAARNAGPKDGSIQGIEKAYNLFMNAPVIIGVLSGDDYIIELANDGLLEVWNRKSDVVGKPLLQAIPELEAQGFIALLDEVRITGKPFYAYDFPITLLRDGKEETLYFDFVYKAVYDNSHSSKASGIVSVGHDVTEKVIARKKVQEAEAKYHSLFDSLDQGFCVLKVLFDASHKPVDYIFIETNAVFENHTGLRDAVGKSAYQMIPNLEPQWRELYGRVATSRMATRFIQASSAMGKWFEVYAFPFGDKGSDLVALLFTDITERQRAEQQIRESEERFRKLADDSPLFVFLIDPDPQATVSYWNKAWLDFTGQNLEQAVGTAWKDIIHPDDVVLIMDSFLPSFEAKKEYVIPAARVKRHDGFYRWHSFKGNPRYSADNEFVGYIGVGIDIHEQKLSAEALMQSEKNLRNVILQAPVAMGILKGPDFVVEIANEKMYELWGRPKEALLGKPIFEGLPEVRDQGYEQLLTQVYQSGEPFSAYGVPVTLPRQNGVETVYINLLYEAFREADGTVSGIMAVATDVTAQVLARQQIEEIVGERTRELNAANHALLRTNQELARSNDNLEQFAYAASHDLKEPMRKIQMFTDRLQHRLGEKLSADEKTSFEKIMSATDRMRTLIDELLMYSHFSTGVERQLHVNLNDIVRLVLDDLEVEIEEKKADIVVDNLPSVLGNPRQLQQLFHNLIGNSLKYSKPDVAPHVQINITSPEAGLNGHKRYHIIEVKDNGIGFDEIYRDRIFNVFTRLHSADHYKGTGIGLAIARKVAENHEGTISATSKPGQGATFTIFLPVKDL